MGDNIIVTAIILTAIVICVILVAWYAHRTEFFKNKKEATVIDKTEIASIFRIELTPAIQYRQSLSIPIIVKEAFSTDVAVATDYHAADLILFESLNNIELILEKIVLPLSAKYVNAFVGVDAIASKKSLATFLKGTRCAPRSWALSDVADRARFVSDFSKDDIYILKTNVQEQKGLFITRGNSSAEILNAFDATNNFVICQRLLQDPFTVADRKINIRVYMLVTLRPGHDPVFYIYDDGFIYYAEKPWVANSVDHKVNITTGLMDDRTIYENNPLTRKEFNEFIGPRRAHVLNQSIQGCINTLKMKYSAYLKTANAHLATGTTFYQVLGIDIAPNNRLETVIMEVNKGPSLNYKDARDRHVKLGFMTAVMRTLQHENDPGLTRV